VIEAYAIAFVCDAVEFVWRDLWLGAYYDGDFYLYVCLFPMLVIRIQVKR
jgi:hypothetical protein